MSRASANRKFIPVHLESLSEGQLAETELFVHLPANDRYIRLVRPLIPIEPWALERFRKFGSVFSSGQSADEKYQLLEESARATLAVCANDDLAPYEKNREIRTRTDWLVPLVLGQGRALEAAVFFIHRAFGLPRPETLLHVLDASVAAYERSVCIAAVSGVMALWLGYNEVTFLRQFIEAAFCQDARRAYAWLGDGQAPGTEVSDHRFAALESSRDELAEIVRLAGALCGVVGAEAVVDRPRVARKLGRQFNLDSISVATGALVASSSRKAAA